LPGDKYCHSRLVACGPIWLQPDSCNPPAIAGCFAIRPQRAISRLSLDLAPGSENRGKSTLSAARAEREMFCASGDVLWHWLPPQPGRRDSVRSAFIGFFSIAQCREVLRGQHRTALVFSPSRLAKLSGIRVRLGYNHLALVDAEGCATPPAVPAAAGGGWRGSRSVRQRKHPPDRGLNL